MGRRRTQVEPLSGLLIGGRLVPVLGVEIIGPHETKWAHLGVGDSRPRHGRPNMVIVHTTKGVWPQIILPGKGPAGRDERTARMWDEDPTYSGAHIVVGSDGRAACLVDLLTVCAYHATISNDRAIGIEIYQEPGGVIYQAAIDSAVRICDAIADAPEFLIPRQYPSRPYLNKPLARMLEDGGRDCYGFFGHRDNTSRRGQGDPGDAFFRALGRARFEGLDIAAGEDLAIWRKRQSLLVAMGEHLVIDGIPGPATMSALHRRGFRDGRDLLPVARTT